MDYSADIYFLSQHIQNVNLFLKIMASRGRKMSNFYRTSMLKINIHRNRDHRDHPAVAPESFEDKDIDRISKNTYSGIHNVFPVLTLLPWEALAFSLGYDNYMYLRLLRLYHAIYLFQYWRNLTDSFAVSNVTTTTLTLTTDGVRAIGFSFVMVIIGLIAACMYYGIAIGTMIRGNPISWLSLDNLAHIREEDLGSIIYTSTANIRYLRAFYWSMQTLVRSVFII